MKAAFTIAVSAIASFAAAAPPRYVTTNETADFNLVSDNGPTSQDEANVPGPYKGLYYGMGLTSYYLTHFSYYCVGVCPPQQYAPAGQFHATNGSSGTLSVHYDNSSVDHFQMYGFLAGCNGYAYYSPSPSQGLDVAYPVNCTITARAFGKGATKPFGVANFKYQPVLYDSAFYNNGTAPMQQFYFPAYFKNIDHMEIVAQLINRPPGVNFTASRGIDMLVDHLTYSISNRTN